jgi:ABC-type molybdate transport system substrate-binding protein
LQSGVLDVGFFYWTETADAKIPALSFPPAITPEATYTVTILRSAPNPEGADEFVAFQVLLGGTAYAAQIRLLETGSSSSTCGYGIP